MSNPSRPLHGGDLVRILQTARVLKVIDVRQGLARCGFQDSTSRMRIVIHVNQLEFAPAPTSESNSPELCP